MSNEVLTDNDRKQLLSDVEEAARAGAASGATTAAKRSGRRSRLRLPWVRIVLVLVAIAAIAGAFFGVKGLIESTSTHRGESIFDVEGDVEDKDLTIENHGFFGYKAADFAEVVLGDTTHPKKLEVYTVRLSEVTTLTAAGLANLTIFSKVQYITFNGVAVYTVDLGQLNEYCIEVDNLARTVTLHVPHALLGSLDIPAEEIEFSDVERGILAFGDIKLTPEEQAALETAAKAEMEKKLAADRVQLDADRFARLAVWEIYQPLISSVAPGYTLTVEFMG